MNLLALLILLLLIVFAVYFATKYNSSGDNAISGSESSPNVQSMLSPENKYLCEAAHSFSPGSECANLACKHTSFCKENAKKKDPEEDCEEACYHLADLLDADGRPEKDICGLNFCADLERFYPVCHDCSLQHLGLCETQAEISKAISDAGCSNLSDTGECKAACDHFQNIPDGNACLDPYCEWHDDYKDICNPPCGLGDDLENCTDPDELAGIIASECHEEPTKSIGEGRCYVDENPISGGTFQKIKVQREMTADYQGITDSKGAVVAGGQLFPSGTEITGNWLVFYGAGGYTMQTAFFTSPFACVDNEDILISDEPVSTMPYVIPSSAVVYESTGGPNYDHYVVLISFPTKDTPNRILPRLGAYKDSYSSDTSTGPVLVSATAQTNRVLGLSDDYTILGLTIDFNDYPDYVSLVEGDPFPSMTLGDYSHEFTVPDVSSKAFDEKDILEAFASHDQKVKKGRVRKRVQRRR